MSGPAIPIPVTAVQEISRVYGYDQVVVMARRPGPGGWEHVTTYGADATHSAIAARMGDQLKRVLQWPSCPATEISLAETNKILRQALTKQAETLHDLRLALLLLNHPTAAKACEVAEDAARTVLATS